MNAPNDRAVAEEQSRRQRDRAIEIIADAMDEYGMDYERMTEQPTAGEVAARLLASWATYQRMEAIIENDYASDSSLFVRDVTRALLAQGDRNANLSAAYEQIGERLVKATRDYIFRVHAMNDADEAAQRLAQRTTATPFPPDAGEVYAGLSRNHDTGAWHHLVLLPATTDKDLKWQEAIEWAKSVGGELPTRFESALLYANVRDQIDQDYWHWTATDVPYEPLWAWGQTFDYGNQDLNRKDYHPFRARAVRRVPFK